MSYKEQNSRPFSVDAYNHLRITHPDRELRPIIRRIHRLATSSVPSSSQEGGQTDGESSGNGLEEGYDEAHERDLVRLDLQRWKSTIERVLGSVSTLESQTEMYKLDIQKTRARTEMSRSALEEEKEVLKRKRKERDEMVECDKITKKIKARGKTRSQLEEQISQLKQSIEGHKSTHELYLTTAQDRATRFKEIISLVSQVRDIKLPDTIAPEETVGESDPMDVDVPEEDKSVNPRLNGSALPFQPPKSQPRSSSNHANGTSSTPVTRASTPAPSAQSGRHNLPARPGRTVSSNTANMGRGGNAGTRPSNLRTATSGRVGVSSGSLEEGEVGGDEEGEVRVQRSQPKRDERPSRTTRNQR